MYRHTIPWEDTKMFAGRKKRKSAPYSDLRSRLEEYSGWKEKARWQGSDDTDSGGGSILNLFPLSILKDMHNFLLFKITLAFLVVLVVLLISFVKLPFTASILEKIQYVTTWEMDFISMGREAVPAIRKLWEGSPESGLEQYVMAPGGGISTDAEKEIRFIAPLHGELEKTFGLNFNALLQKEEMSYGLVFSTLEGASVHAAAGGCVAEIKEDPVYGLHLLVEHYPTGMETFYGYLGEVLVEEGEEIAQGQEIAYLRANPSGKKSTLYFEIRKYGEPVDPLPLLVGEQ
jgi:hypothetical protein